jgi:rhodanese-related sulfurtransferase
MLRTDPAVAEIEVAALAACASPALVDVREPVEFAQGHVPGAINIP